MEDIILLGIGGHARSVVDSIEQAGKYNIKGFLDTEEMQGKRFRDYNVLGTDSDIRQFFGKGVRNAFVTIGFMGHGTVRNRLYEQLRAVGYLMPNIIDNTAAVSQNAELEDGIFVGKNAVINSDAKIGRMCIINTSAVVEHSCHIGRYSHIAVGSVLCGGVSVGEQTLIGANATVIQNIEIGRNVIVGAGMTIRKDVEDYKMIHNNDKSNNVTRGGYNLNCRERCAA